MRLLKNIKYLICSTAVLVIAVMLIYDSSGVINSVIACTEVCLNTLVPSLCGYMILSSFIVNSRIGAFILKPLKSAAEKAFHTDLCVLTALLISQIGGYPVGVKMCSDLISHNKNYSEICRKLLPVMYASGPAFVTGVAGLAIYKSVNAGMIIFLSCLTANLIIAAVILFMNRKKSYMVCENEGIDISVNTVSRSVRSSFSALAVVCSFVIAFNILTELIDSMLPAGFTESRFYIYFKSIWEISNIRQLTMQTPLWLTAAFISFGGICVIFQVISLADFKIRITGFISARCAISVLTALICAAAERIFGFEYTAETAAYRIGFSAVCNPAVLICLFAMTIILLSSAENNYEKYKKNCKKG